MADVSQARNLPIDLPFTPSSPFTDHIADTILRSSDGCDFRVQRVILSRASPFFKDMFSLPQPSDASDVPVIPVAEAGRLFDSFLQLWYPGAQLLMTFSGVEELNTLLELTLCKYDPALENYLQAYIEQHPVGVFALACQYGWGQLARTAAKQSLNFDFRTVCLRSGNNSQIKHISVELFQALLVYHDACGVAASSAGRLLPWTDPRYSWIRCASCAAHTASSEVPGLGPRFSRAWIIDYLDEAAAMLKARPGASVEDHLFLANKYVPAVNAAIDAVPLEIPF
ncbi:BTB domain-containing protein [Mycena sanguinolenta]|uniref:BTB domain-containing protein n=1 Tax=Mycena sanguinolenta TaxID=230812 RepID=A0A8H6Z2J9_9AGAR|nr:BTB domain-containing protein [Mycena sanguinolenta]